MLIIKILIETLNNNIIDHDEKEKNPDQNVWKLTIYKCIYKYLIISIK